MSRGLKDVAGFVAIAFGIVCALAALSFAGWR